VKRILTLDGGGIRGVFSLAILQHIEALFRRHRGRPDLVLRDEFDFFAGTSTGAIIATCLAWGLGADEILRLYEERGSDMFARAIWHQRFFRNKYRADVIAEFFRSQFTDDDGTPALLGTRKLSPAGRQKYLLLVMRNATTGSAWPVSNNPAALFNDPQDPGCNLNVPLWKLLRASSAAPTFFPPEEITLGGRTSLFVDGGLTPYNNPALIAALTATLPAYRMNWRATPDDLLVVSVGTGHVRAQLRKSQARELHTLDFARYIAPAMISSVATEQDMICRILGRCLHGADLDMELGNLHTSGLLEPAEKKFSYVRYDRRFTADETDAFEKATKKQFSLDNLDLIPELKKFGTDYALAHVRPEHLGL
jgi:Patatin